MTVPPESRTRFLIFTKTRWSEPPRLRHQVAQMLAARGHQVVFFEKSVPFQRRRVVYDGAIELRRYRQLIHHQLRIGPRTEALNGGYEKRQLNTMLGGVEPDDVVLNFNYDYGFLREVLPENRILSVFNDDFIALAKPYRRAWARNLVRGTAGMSDHNLVVSHPLYDQIAEFSDRVSLLLPWARRAYSPPAASHFRSDVLYWGFIGRRLDWSVVRHFNDRGVQVHLVGPRARAREAEAVMELPNVSYHGVGKLDELLHVIQRCTCSILPYDLDRVPPAVSASNRTFDLLSCGLPLLYAAFPGLIEAPEGVIYRCASVDEYWAAYLAACRDFGRIQPTIREFLRDHTESRRYDQLMGIVEGLHADAPATRR